MNGIEAAFVGSIGTAPELRTSKSGKPWCSFSARVGEGEAATWVRVAVFGETADAATTLAKGTPVYVEGRLRLGTWQTKDGESRSGLSVVATKVELLGQIGRRRPTTSSGNAGTRSAGADDWQRPLGAGHKLQSAPRACERKPLLDDAIPF